MNKLESEGYNAIMDEVRIADDPADPWGSNISWLFAIADFMYAMNGECLPGCVPSPMGVNLEDCTHELETLFSIVERPVFIHADDFRRAYHILSRRDDILRVLGKNY